MIFSISTLRKWWVERNSCSAIFARYAARYPGIAAIRFDHRKNLLEIMYSSGLSPEQASNVLDRISRELAVREPICSLRHRDGWCADCTSSKEVRSPRQRQSRNSPVVYLEDTVLTLTRPGTTLEKTQSLARKIRVEPKTRPFLWSRSFWEPLLCGLTFLSLIASWLADRFAGGLLVWIYVFGFIAGGFYGVKDAFTTLRARRLDVNFLMVAAALGAAAIHFPREALILLFLFSLSNTLQGFALSHTRRAIRGLMTLQPETATRIRNGTTETVLVDLLDVGDVVLVKPGERIPADGVVIRGESEVDQSPITGESVPVWKARGAQVFTGSLNGSGFLEIEITARSDESIISRIMKLVEEADSHKAKAQLFLERFEQAYAVIVVGLSVLVAVSLPLVLGMAWDLAFYRAMTLLVVASPCALVMSTPAALLSAITSAARRGVLFKGGDALERLAEIRAIAFDKTGTLTRGRLRVTQILPIGVSLTELLQLMLDVESLSEHALAGAIVGEASRYGLRPGSVEAFEAIPGKGVVAVRNNHVIRIGTPRFVTEAIGKPMHPKVQDTVKQWQETGQTVLVITEGDEWRGVLAIADELRSDAAETITRLKKKGISPIAVLTGDSQRVALNLARQLQIDEVEPELLPEEKLEVLRRLERRSGPVAMVGDGVNDAPALAAAHIGIAMGSGTDLALETADIALLGNNLSQLPFAVGLAKQTMRLIYQNLAFAVAIIVFLILVTFFGDLRLPLAVFGHEGSTVIVVLNGMRLLTYRDP